MWSDTQDVSHLKAEVKWGALPARQKARLAISSPLSPAGTRRLVASESGGWRKSRSGLGT